MKYSQGNFDPNKLYPKVFHLHLCCIGILPAVTVVIIFGPYFALWVFLAFVVPGIIIGIVRDWLSVFSWRLAIAGSFMSLLTLFLPLSLGPALMAVPPSDQFHVLLVVTGIHLAVFCVAVLWYWLHFPLPEEGARKIEWQGLQLNLVKRIILKREPPSSSIKFGGTIAVFGCIPLYHLLEPYLETSGGMFVFALVMNILMNILMLTLMVTMSARPMAEALWIRTIEKTVGPFKMEGLRNIEKERQQYAFGRFLRRCFPLDPRLLLNPQVPNKKNKSDKDDEDDKPMG